MNYIFYDITSTQITYWPSVKDELKINKMQSSVSISKLINIFKCKLDKCQLKIWSWSRPLLYILIMTSFLSVFNPSTAFLLRLAESKANVFRLTKNSGKVDLLKIDITFIEIWKWMQESYFKKRKYLYNCYVCFWSALPKTY